MRIHKTANPTSDTMSMVVSTSLLSRERRRHERRRSPSKITVNPTPPRTLRTPNAASTLVASTRRPMLAVPGSTLNPALVNAEMAWNADHHRGFSMSASPVAYHSTKPNPTAWANSVSAATRQISPSSPPG